ncbi:MAG: GNAT family N-acetyltransferase [Candidatus Bathyarchaeia archaeon]
MLKENPKIMKILTYRDLESKDGLLPLMDNAFRWPFNSRWFDDFIKIDPRLKNSPVGFCALENGAVVGFVGVFDLATRTLNGDVEFVGGIYGVATLPSHVRRGISKTLMEKAHAHFKEKGYRFSFLTTSRTIIAHAFYEKLGYFDLFDSPSAYKILEAKKKKPSVKGEKAKLDFDKILQIYNAYVEGKTGFVVRDKAHLRMLKKAESLSPNQCIINDEGYVFFRREKGGICVRELVALNAQQTNRLIGLVEDKAKDMVYERTVLDKTMLQVYKSRGYIIQNKSHWVMMIKPLTQNASFKQIYGEKFFFTGLDAF